MVPEADSGPRFRGGNRALWHAQGESEILVSGAAGTGKTFAILSYLWAVADRYPGARILLTRRERTRITRSVLVTFERELLERRGGWRDVVNRSVTREHRLTYRLRNGSEFIVQGAEDIQALLSQEYDIAYWNEVTELPTHEAFESLHRALRAGPVPFRQLIADCNPNRPNHWILKRCERGITHHIRTRLQDNPAFYDDEGNPTAAGKEYVSRLGGGKLTGVTYRRLFLGEWCAAEGLVLPKFAEREDLFRPLPPPWLELPGGRRERDWSKLGSGVRFWFASMDWGVRAPGVLAVWGKDADDRCFRVAEIYRKGQDVNWWAKQACAFVAEFRKPSTPFVAIVADSAGKDQIQVFNNALHEQGYGVPCVPCEKDFEANLDVVRAAFNPDDPRAFLVQDSTRLGRDPELDAMGAPCSTEEELLLLAYPDATEKPHRAKDERPDPDHADHGFDQMLYGLGFAWRRQTAFRIPEPKFEPGSAGHILGHERKWRAMRRNGLVKDRYGRRS